MVESNARWLKDEFAANTSLAVPHGWCGRPINDRCPHASACWTCDSFNTRPVLLAEIRIERDHAAKTAKAADKEGRTRVAQMNAEVAENMTRIIDAIESAVQETALESEDEHAAS